MNRCCFIGNLGKNPTLNYKDELAICRFSIAVADRNDTDWINVTVFAKQAVNCAEYLAKGSKVGVSGRLKVSQLTDESGNNRTYYGVIADSVDFLTPKASNTNQQRQGSVPDEPPDFDDVPF